MKRFVLAIVFVLFLAGSVLAGQKYNPMENRWETVPNREKTQLRYNPHENDWSYQSPQAQPEYNPHENRWDWQPNPYEMKWGK